MDESTKQDLVAGMRIRRQRDPDWDPDREHDREKHNRKEPQCQTHDHEFLGSTMLAAEEDICHDRHDCEEQSVGSERHHKKEQEEVHNHRFASVTTEEIPHCGSHVHGFMVNTDFFDHHHEIAGQTETAVEVGDGKHVHFAEGTTTEDDGHVHEFQFATLIDSPLLPGKHCRKEPD